MADTGIASVIQVLPPVSRTPAPKRAGTAGRPNVETSPPSVEQARLIASKTSLSSVKRQTNLANKQGVALYQTVKETISPQGVSQGLVDGPRHRSIDLLA